MIGPVYDFIYLYLCLIRYSNSLVRFRVNDLHIMVWVDFFLKIRLRFMLYFESVSDFKIASSHSFFYFFFRLVGEVYFLTEVLAHLDERRLWR